MFSKMQSINEQYFKIGVVEDTFDPLKLGRYRVRVVQIHTDNLGELPTEDLPWAEVVQPITSAAISGVGDTPRLLRGTWVIVSFLDAARQKPIIWGALAGIPGSQTNLQPTDTNIIAELVNNVPPSAPPAKTTQVTNGVTVTTEPAYIGSLTATQVDTLKAAIKKLDSTSDIDKSLRTNYTQLANAGMLSVDAKPEKSAGLLMAAHFKGATAAVNYVKEINTGDAAGQNASDYYRLGYAALTGVTTYEQPTQENLSLPASDVKSSQNQNALKYDTGITRGTGKQGFQDPTGKYPLKNHLNESDLNLLARGSKISQTIVGEKESTRIKDIPVALSSSTWSQSPIPYGAIYPNNRVIATESGHVFELDDTPGNERINLHHKAGTFTEIDSQGNETTRTKGSRTIIVEKDEMVYIKGGGYVTVDGNHAILVKKALSIEVLGDANIKVAGNCTHEVTGDYNLTANNITMYAKTSGKFSSTSTMEVGSQGTFTVGGTGTMINALGNMGAPVVLTGTSTGTAKPANQLSTTIQIPSPVTRQEVADMTLEGAEDITKILYQDAPVPVITKSDTTPANEVIQVTGICGFTDLSLDMQLTTNYKLIDLCGTHPFPLRDGQHNLSAEELACNLKQLAINVLEPLREKYAAQGFKINSCFREAGSSISKAKGISQHELGCAVDISFGKIRGQANDKEQFYNLANEIKNVVPSDQLLLEYRSTGSVWIHISFRTGNLRREILTLNDDKVIGKGLILIA